MVGSVLVVAWPSGDSVISSIRETRFDNPILLSQRSLIGLQRLYISSYLHRREPDPVTYSERNVRQLNTHFIHIPLQWVYHRHRRIFCEQLNF